MPDAVAFADQSMSSDQTAEGPDTDTFGGAGVLPPPPPPPPHEARLTATNIKRVILAISVPYYFSIEKFIEIATEDTPV